MTVSYKIEKKHFCFLSQVINKLLIKAEDMYIPFYFIP